MKSRVTILGLAVLLCLALIMIGGCAKKTKVAIEPAVSTPEQPAATAPGSATGGTPGERKPAPAIQEEGVGDLAMKESAVVKDAASETAGLPGKSAVDFADITFDFDRYDLSAEARQTLKQHADWLLKNTNYTVVVEGHCDDRGTTEYNLALGQKRAAEAMKFLADLGVDAGRIKIISYGEEMPLDPAHTEEAWAKNRRGHFVVTPAK